jgi:hypothetical protein
MTVRSHHPGRLTFLLVPLASVICLTLIAPAETRAQSSRWKFTKIADRNSPIPGATGNFTSFSPPSLESGLVAFGGWGPNGAKGVYSATIGGPVTLVADDSTGVPGPRASLIPVHAASIDGSRTALGGFNRVTQGIYRVEDGAVSVVADTATPIPSGIGTFKLSTDFYEGVPSADNGRIAFPGLGDNMQAGVYLATAGGLTRVVDANALVPNDTRNFQTFGSVILDDDRLAFIGNESNRGGVYVHNLATGNLTLVADSTTLLPGRTDTFRNFYDNGRGIDIDGSQVAFIGSFANTNGVYLYDSDSGALSTVADFNTPVPGSGGATFADYFNGLAIDNGRVVVQNGGEVLQTQSPTNAPAPPPVGVFANFDGTLEKVIASGDMLDGRPVYYAQIGPESLDGDQIAIHVNMFSAEAIYVATLIPEPATFALLVPPCLLIAFIAYRRSRARTSDLPIHTFTRAISRLAPPLITVLLLATSAESHAQSPRFKFTKIADQSTLMPDSTVNFLYFNPPALESGRVAFDGSNSFHADRLTGLYTALVGGPLTRVADNTMGIPGPVFSLFPYHAVSIDRDRIVFGGLNSLTQSIYSHENESIRVVADTNTPIPSGTGNFALDRFWTGSPSADEGRVAFVAVGEGTQNGVYIASATGIARIADTATPIPGDTSTFQRFGSVKVDDGQVALSGGDSSRSGYYLHDLSTGLLTRIVDTTTPVPGRAESFRGFTAGDLDGGQFAFLDTEPNYFNSAYVYESATGIISTVLAPGMPIPDGGGRLFTGDFNAISIDQGRLVVQSGGEDRLMTNGPTEPNYGFPGVYGYFGGPLEKVLANGDILDGHLVSTVRIGPESLSGDQVALLVSYAGGSGIYIATLIPEPATLAILSIAFASLALIAHLRSRIRIRPIESSPVSRQ